MRTLEEIKLPSDYLSHIPGDPSSLGLKMQLKASQLFPLITRDDGVVRESSYRFLYIGPGAEYVIAPLQDDHSAFGIDLMRPIILNGELTLKNVYRCLPWELPFANKREDSHNYKMFHIALLSKYYKTLLTNEEWQETIKESKRVSKYSALIP